MMKIGDCRLAIADCGFRIRDLGFTSEIRNHAMKVRDCRFTNYDLQFTIWELLLYILIVTLISDHYYSMPLAYHGIGQLGYWEIDTLIHNSPLTIHKFRIADCGFRLYIRDQTSETSDAVG